MLKSAIAATAVGLVVLFGFFYASNRANVSRTEKAKQAATEVGDVVRDKGVATLVSARLAKTFGLEATRFLHVYYDEGQVLLYGLVPAGVDQEQLASEAIKVPGVTDAEVLVQLRPDYIPPLGTLGGPTTEPQATPETP